MVLGMTCIIVILLEGKNTWCTLVVVYVGCDQTWAIEKKNNKQTHRTGCQPMGEKRKIRNKLNSEPK